ncbi:hypothetical protein NDU88_000928 [Pleurodeles waltl]|uniref:Uncharacterized protein n=1 Tax=Pleurodeles waltl TaxID=8319 RepID=A0AAV7LWC0_PLEWA|nr:hypothetical protein NDU88_000928 [Pleurodeles waltl]
MEKGGGEGGGEIVPPLVGTFSVVPALLPGRRVKCGSLTPWRISPGDLCILCRLLLTVPRLISLFHGRAVPGSPFTLLCLSSQALSVGKEGTRAGRKFLASRLALTVSPGFGPGHNGCRSGCRRAWCVLLPSQCPRRPCFCRDAKLSY